MKLKKQRPGHKGAVEPVKNFVYWNHFYEETGE
jgi:hypothetical protein